MGQDVSFEIGSPIREYGAFHCVVNSEIFSSPKKIYGSNAAEARVLAIRFASAFHAAGATRTKAGNAGVVGAVLRAAPTAGVSSAADGPLPVGELIGVLILIGAAIGAAFTLPRKKVGDGPCDRQYVRDIAICR